MISNLQDQLVRDEGVRLKPYRDSVGKLTIGIGRNLDDVGISQIEADFLLANDIKNAVAQLEARFPWTVGMDEARKGVLLNMTFNLGIVGLSQFKNTLAMIESREYTEAAKAMLESEWARQVGPRATRLSVQMQSGIWT